MTSRTRCPHCSAALPVDATWCSLCHADLRPEPVPVASTASTESTESTASTASADLPGSGACAPLGHGADEALLPPVRGRHRRLEEPTPALPGPAAGEPTAGSAPTRHHLPLDADGRPDVEAAAARMLAELAGTEASSGLPDLERVPGGKWGLLFGGMAAVAVVCLIVATVAAVFVH